MLKKRTHSEEPHSELAQKELAQELGSQLELIVNDTKLMLSGLLMSVCVPHVRVIRSTADIDRPLPARLRTIEGAAHKPAEVKALNRQQSHGQPQRPDGIVVSSLKWVCCVLTVGALCVCSLLGHYANICQLALTLIASALADTLIPCDFCLRTNSQATMR